VCDAHCVTEDEGPFGVEPGQDCSRRPPDGRSSWEQWSYEVLRHWACDSVCPPHTLS
jgi:hypothetical protein